MEILAFLIARLGCQRVYDICLKMRHYPQVAIWKGECFQYAVSDFTGIAGFGRSHCFAFGRKKDRPHTWRIGVSESLSQDGDRHISMDNRRLYAFRMAFDDDNYEVAWLQVQVSRKNRVHTTSKSQWFIIIVLPNQIALTWGIISPFSRNHTKPSWVCSRCQSKDSQAKKTTEQLTFIAKPYPFVVGIQWNCGIITQLRLIQRPWIHHALPNDSCCRNGRSFAVPLGLSCLCKMNGRQGPRICGLLLIFGMPSC